MIKLLVYKNHVDPAISGLISNLKVQRNNRSAIGAIVTDLLGFTGTGAGPYRGDRIQLTEPATHSFRLGESERVDSVEIRWPGGEIPGHLQPEAHESA